MLHHKVAVRDESGHIVKWYGSSFEIEDRKQAELKMSGSEANLRRIIDTIPALVSGFLPDGSNEFMNQRWHDYTGLSLEQSQNGGWQEPVHLDDLPPLVQRFREALVSENREKSRRAFAGTTEYFAGFSSARNRCVTRAARS